MTALVPLLMLSCLWWQDEKAVIDLGNKEVDEKAHIAKTKKSHQDIVAKTKKSHQDIIAALEGQTASTLEHLERAKAEAQRHKAQGESCNTITFADKMSPSARGLDCDSGMWSSLQTHHLILSMSGLPAGSLLEEDTFIQTEAGFDSGEQ